MPLQIIRLMEALRKLHHKSTTLPAASMITTNTTTKPMIPSPPSRRRSINDDLCCCKHGHDISGQVNHEPNCCCRDDDVYVPADVQKGYFAVYVVDGGDEEEEEEEESINVRRYVIPVSYLRHRVFAALLSRAEEEFGFSHNYKGGIRFPCETVLFDHLLWLLNRDDPSIHSLEVDELLNFYRP